MASAQDLSTIVLCVTRVSISLRLFDAALDHVQPMSDFVHRAIDVPFGQIGSIIVAGYDLP